MIKRLIVLSLVCTGNVYGYSFTPATNFQAVVAASVATSTAGVSYAYRIASSTSSGQNIISIFVELNQTAAEGISPAGWKFEITSDADTTHRGYWAEVSTENDIVPGGTRDGFIVNSQFAPTVGRMYLRGNAPLPSFEDGEDIPAGAFPASIYDDAVIIMTIVPSSFTVSASTASVERLIASKHRVASLGWISGPGSDGLVRSLDVKLDAAKVALSRGQKTEAANHLKAFINELKAQRGKKINENAFVLLNSSAELIIGRLGS